MAQYFHPIAWQKRKYFRLKLQVNRIDLNTVSRSFSHWCLSMNNIEALFKSSWGLFIVCARLTFSLLGYKIRNVSPSFKSRNVNHWYCHLCTSLEHDDPFWWYDGNWIDELLLVWLSFPRSSHIKLMLKTFLPLLPFFSSQQVTYFMLIAILYREGNYFLIGILTKLRKHQSSLPFGKKGLWPADKNASETCSQSYIYPWFL